MSSGLKLIVGLGNPGPDYAGTRHNAGEDFARELLRLHGGILRSEAKFHGLSTRIHVNGQDLWLLVPTTWMNRSGRAVAAFANFYRIEPQAMLVAHDELDFEPGQCRIKHGGGHGGHNGLRDVIAALGDTDFYRLRIGIGHPGSAREVERYVLRRAPQEEAERTDAAIAEAIAVLPQMLAGQWPLALNRLHSFDASVD